MIGARAPPPRAPVSATAMDDVTSNLGGVAEEQYPWVRPFLGPSLLRRIEFVDEMPKNELGKILKNRLRETYAS